jgi:hypothetical protein
MPTLGVNSGTGPNRLCDARAYRGSKSPINAKVAVIQTARYLYSPIDVGFSVSHRAILIRSRYMNAD